MEKGSAAIVPKLGISEGRTILSTEQRILERVMSQWENERPESVRMVSWFQGERLVLISSSDSHYFVMRPRLKLLVLFCSALASLFGRSMKKSEQIWPSSVYVSSYTNKEVCLARSP